MINKKFLRNSKIVIETYKKDFIKMNSIKTIVVRDLKNQMCYENKHT